MSKNKNHVSVALFIAIIVLISLLFAFHQKAQNVSELHTANGNSFETHGPYAGYIQDSDREKIDIYTKGEYVTSVAAEIISNFLSQNNEKEQSAYTVTADFYCGMNGDLKWVYATSRPAFHSSIVNLYTSSFENNERTESYYFDITSGGVVTRAVFVSDKVGFVGLNTPTELGFEIYATFDAGESWELVEVQPPCKWSNRYSLIPVTSGSDANNGLYPFILDKVSDKQIIYLTSDDNGSTWYWKE